MSTTTHAPDAATPSGAPFVRLTVLGPERNANLVLPTDQPAALLLPQVLALLEEDAVTGRYELSTLAGEVIDQNLPLRDSRLTDGDLIRLSRSGEEAAAPVVMDVVDVVATAPLTGVWGPVAKSWVHAVVGGLVLLAGVVLLAGGGGSSGREVLWPAAAAVALLAAGALGLTSTVLLRPAMWVLLAGGTVLGGVAVLAAPQPPTGSVGSLLQLVGLAVLALLALGACARRVLVLGVAAALLVVLSGLWAAAWVVTDDDGRTAAVMGVVSVLVLGLVPRVALGASGLFTLDARIMRGDRVTRGRAGDAVVEAHWLLGSCVPVVAASLATAGWLLGRDGDLSTWPALLLALTALAWLLRGRHFPLALERFAIWVAVLPGLVAVAVHLGDRDDARVAVAAAVLVLGAGLVALGTFTAADYTGAQLRRAATRLETLAVLSLVPVLVGYFGVYGDLLDTFG